MNKITSSLSRGLILLIVPIVELVFLRFFLREGLELRIGWLPHVVDFDLILPGLFGFLLLVHVLDRANKVSLKLRKKPLFVHTSVVALFVVFCLFHTPFQTMLGTSFLVLWWIQVLLLIATSLFIFTGVEYYFRNKNRYAILPCLLITLSIPIHKATPTPLSQLLAKPTAAMSCHMIGISEGVRVRCYTNAQGEAVISHSLFSTALVHGCNGFDGIFLFFQVFLIVLGLKGSQLQVRNWISIALGGVLMMYVLNLIRVYSLFMVGIFLVKNLGAVRAIPLFENLFHTHLGWIFYTIGIGGYFYYLVPWEVKSKGPLNRLVSQAEGIG